MERLVVIHSDGESAWTTKNWLALNSGKAYCQSCAMVNRRNFPVPFDLTLSNIPEHQIAGHVFSTGFHIYNKMFIDQIKEYIGDFTIGKCFSTDDELVDEYVTLYSKRYILIRGNKKSKYETCKKCGTVSSPYWYGRRYVLRSYLTESRVYQSPFNDLCIDEELALEIDFSPWPDVNLETIEIRDEPMDEQEPPYRAEP